MTGRDVRAGVGGAWVDGTLRGNRRLSCCDELLCGKAAQGMS